MLRISVRPKPWLVYDNVMTMHRTRHQSGASDARPGRWRENCWCIDYPVNHADTPMLAPPPPPSPHATTSQRGLRTVVRSTLRGADHSPANRRHAQELVWQWVGSKWPRLLPSPSQREQRNVECAVPGQELAAHSNADGSLWTLAVAFHEKRGGRCWMTRAVVADRQGVDVMALQTSCTELADAPAVVAPPRLLGAWVEHLGLQDGTVAVLGAPRNIDDANQLAAFCGHVLSARRTLPVIALANRPNSRFYGVDPRGLAEAVRGMAHVVCLTPELAALAGPRLGASFSIVPGAARIFAPGFGPQSLRADHPLVRNMRSADASAADAGAFRRLLCQRICALSVHRSSEFDAVLLAA